MNYLGTSFEAHSVWPSPLAIGAWFQISSAHQGHFEHYTTKLIKVSAQHIIFTNTNISNEELAPALGELMQNIAGFAVDKFPVSGAQ